MVDVVKLAKRLCTCPKCKSELAYSYNEIEKHMINHDYLGDYDLVRGIQCPVCKTIIKTE